MENLSLDDAQVQQLGSEFTSKLVEVSQKFTEEVSQMSSPRFAVSLALMCLCEFTVRSHMSVGMTTDTVRDLILQMIEDVAAEKPIDQH